MTILGARSFDMGNSMLNSVDISPASATATASTTEAHTGAYSLRIFGNSLTFVRWAIAGAVSDPSVSVWLKHSTLALYNTAGSIYLRFLLSTGEYIDLRWNEITHTFDAYVDGVLVAAGAIEVSNWDWFHVQFYTVIADAGSIRVVIDGHDSITYNGDTQPGVAATATYLHFSASAGSRTFYVDDLVWGNGALLGDLRVYEKRPASDSAVQWTPSAGGDNYALEDETPQSDADYNYTTTDGHVDEFGLSALNITGYGVAAVVAWTRAQMNAAGGDSIEVGINSGGTVSVVSTALSAAWEYYWGNVHEVDPNTALAWNQAGLDAVLHRKEAVIV